MRIALVNPSWSFDGSIYFGCKDPHLPLEYGYAKVLLEADGHDVSLIDAQLEGIDTQALAARVESFAPDLTVLTTAPSYLFWRCPPPELRVPIETANAIRHAAGRLVIVGPHGSTTPRSTLHKTGADAAVLGECEEVLREIARNDGAWERVDSVAWLESDGSVRSRGRNASCNMQALPALRWPAELLRRHRHHHHRFDVEPVEPGAEIEASRGCPYSCTFCAKDNHRDAYRKRPLATMLDELDGLIEQGVGYVYFIDEIFLPDRALLEAVAQRRIRFGIQTRIDLWSEDLLDLLGAAGCASVEAGIESITSEGRAALDKRCKLTTQQLFEKLIRAKKTIPFVQGTLIASPGDDPAMVENWRDELRRNGVWANEPVPLFPYPGSADYTRRWGLPDDHAWERAHQYYLGGYEEFSDVQEQRPRRLPILEGFET